LHPRCIIRLVRKLNPRIVVAIIAALLDELVLVVMVVWILPKFGITVPVWLVILLAVLFLFSGSWAFVVVKRKPSLGFENQIGVKGVTETVIGRKKGLVRIGRDNWAARTEGPDIEPGTRIVVTGQNALILNVMPDRSERDLR
jgi:membrane protein implicated in regulation of membrane protease activity